MKRFLPLAVFCTAAQSGTRDWASFPAVVQIEHADEIFAIGDAHSDFRRLARAMAAAQIIESAVDNPEDARWRAGHAVLVTTGDMIDIVEGHVPSDVAFADGVTRNSGEMFQRFGLLFLIDTGMSEGVDDSGGADLHITYKNGEQASAICPDGKRTILWDSRTKQDFGRAAPCSK